MTRASATTRSYPTVVPSLRFRVMAREVEWPCPRSLPQTDPRVTGSGSHPEGPRGRRLPRNTCTTPRIRQLPKQCHLAATDAPSEANKTNPFVVLSRAPVLRALGHVGSPDLSELRATAHARSRISSTQPSRALDSGGGAPNHDDANSQRAHLGTQPAHPLQPSPPSQPVVHFTLSGFPNVLTKTKTKANMDTQSQPSYLGDHSYKLLS